MNSWIKICANTSLEDALLGAEAGADALGFVFAPSPRRVTAEQVAAITPHLPQSVEKIGVFVDAGFEEIAPTIRACGLTGVQLHSDCGPDLPAELRREFGPELRILGVVHLPVRQDSKAPFSGKGRSRADRVKSAISAAAQEHVSFGSPFFDSNIDAILVDAYSLTTRGGTGRTFDWGLAAVTLFQTTKKLKCAAGGLTPDNVAEAITILRPWGVDVASGVESAPGRKDPAKVRAFVANARAALDVTFPSE